MSAQTPGCGSNIEARKRNTAAQEDPHAGCTPGTCRDGDQWRTVTCAPTARCSVCGLGMVPRGTDTVCPHCNMALAGGRAADIESTEAASSDEDGPECETCGRTTCPDANLPEFSEPVACAYLQIYNDLRYDRCEYGCGRDVTKETIRRDIVPAVERILAARSTPAPDTAAVEALARLTSDLRAVVAKVDRSWGGAAMVVRDSVAHLLGDRCTNEFCEHDHVAIRAALAPRATTEGSE